MDIKNVNNSVLSSAAEHLRQESSKKNVRADEKPNDVRREADLVEIERENILASGILPTTLKEAAEAIQSLKLQILENPTEAFNVQANLNTPNIVNLL